MRYINKSAPFIFWLRWGLSWPTVSPKSQPTSALLYLYASPKIYQNLSSLLSLLSPLSSLYPNLRLSHRRATAFNHVWGMAAQSSFNFISLYSDRNKIVHLSTMLTLILTFIAVLFREFWFIGFIFWVILQFDWWCLCGWCADRFYFISLIFLFWWSCRL